MTSVSVAVALSMAACAFLLSLPWMGPVASFFLSCIGAILSFIGYRDIDKRLSLAKTRPLVGTFHQQETARQTAIARMMPSYMADSIIALILEYEHTRITMGCCATPWANSPSDTKWAYKLVADNDTMMHFSAKAGPVSDIHMRWQLPFRPVSIHPRGVGSE
jgi:hypothetical protein